MTILSKGALVDFLDLIADGTTIADASVAIGCKPNSKSAFGWIAASEAAGEFGARPDAGSIYCVQWGERDLEWFHNLYQEAVAAGKAVRAQRVSPLRAELQARLEAKRSEQPKPNLPPPIEVFKPDDEPPTLSLVVNHVVQAPIAPPPSPPRPSYAYRRPPPLDSSGYTEPPATGGFSIARHRVSQAERLAGTVSFGDDGIKRW